MADEDRRPRVFISYAHDSDRHREQVRRFAHLLRGDGGIDVRLDEWDTHLRRDWSAWMIDQLQHADFVLVVASPAYKRRAEGQAEAADGRGVQFEAALLRDLLTMDRPTWVPKVLPVLLPGRSIDEIPIFLQPYSASRYEVRTFTIDGVDELYRVITRQPRHPLPGLGPLLVRPPAGPPGGAIQLDGIDYFPEWVNEEVGPGDGWTRRLAIFRRPEGLVTVHQLHVLKTEKTAERQRAALLAVGRLLVDTAAVPGIPRLLDQSAGRESLTLVLARPEAPSLRDVYYPPPLSPNRTTSFVQVIYELCRSLQQWHERGFSHRALTADGIVFVNGGQTPALLDIGLAGTETADGPQTDVFQLAAIVDEVLAGWPSSPKMTELLADAQSATPAHRPRDAAAFGTALLLAMPPEHTLP